MEGSVSTDEYLVSENYVVQGLGTIVDCDFFRSGHLTLGAQAIIQFTDFHSNDKSKEFRSLHPLEIEIQRDNELRVQQEKLIKCPTVSVIRSPVQIQEVGQEKLHCGPGTCYRLLGEGVSCRGSRSQRGGDDTSRENAEQEREEIGLNFTLDKPGSVEKNQVQPVQEHLNFEFDKNESLSKNNRGKSVKNYVDKLSVCLGSKNEINCMNGLVESDSENEEDEVEPVCDYEPDPHSNTDNNCEQFEKSNKCYMCFKSFRQKKNMYAHIRKIHSTQPKIPGGILCPLCKMHALRQEHLRTHLETLHAIPIEKEEKLFDTMEEFFMWKEAIEKETFSFYISKSSSKLLANNQQKTYYKCHRSGNYENHKKGNNRKKVNAAEASNKIGATCPAAMEMTENLQGINVIFWKTHVGHDNAKSDLALGKNEKVKVIDHSPTEFSWSKILEIYKGYESPDFSSKLPKEHLRNLNSKKIKSRSEFYSKKPGLGSDVSGIAATLGFASQSSVVEKAETLLRIVETTDIRSDFRPKVCLMIDNLISTIKRRSARCCGKEKEKNREKKNRSKRKYRAGKDVT